MHLSGDNENTKSAAAGVQVQSVTNLHALARDRKFATILADPPWRFDNKTGKVAPGHRRLNRYESCSAGPYLELFARGTRPGWTAWGNQADDSYRPTWKTYSRHSQSDRTASVC